MAKGKVVLWAVDPWDRSGSPSLEEVRRLARVASRERLKLVPVHVVSFSEALWEKGAVPPVPEVQDALAEYLRPFHLSQAEPVVIVDESGTRAGAVRELLRLADERGAEWIMVSSHGKSGVSRLMLGSFAELLVRHSRVPLYILPREALRAPLVRASRVALFPTDLSPAAHVAFTRFLKIAASQRLEIAILHEISYPVPSLDLGIGAVTLGEPVPLGEEERRALAQNAGATLVEEAKRAGVKARFAVGSGVLAITGEAVLAAARREKARVIAMPSMSGPFRRLLADSVAQKVFRSGGVPVCLYGPEAIGPEAA